MMIRYVLAFIIFVGIFGASQIFADTVTWSQQYEWVPPIPSVVGGPECTTHDSTKHHFLVDPNTGCHYDHEHHDDSNWVNDSLGTPGEWFGNPGQSISYPWQTGNGTENHHKHEGYKTLVRKNLPCVHPNTKAVGCFKDVRLQIHTVASAKDASVRFHSYAVETTVTHDYYPGLVGYISFGGHMDTGTLHVDGNHVPLPDDPVPLTFDKSRRKGHSWETNGRNSTWYASISRGAPAFNHGTIALTFETFGGVNPADPFYEHLWCPNLDCKLNGSRMFLHSLKFEVGPGIRSLVDPDGNGIADDVSLYVDPAGNVAESCTEPSLTCVPLRMKNVPVVGIYHHKDSYVGINLVEYDTSPAMQGGGDWWIRYPN